MRILLICAVLLCACVHPVTAVGVKECWTTWYVIGYYRGCAEGPSWQQQLTDPAGVHAARAVVSGQSAGMSAVQVPAAMPVVPRWCFDTSHGQECRVDHADCDRARADAAGALRLGETVSECREVR